MPNYQFPLDTDSIIDVSGHSDTPINFGDNQSFDNPMENPNRSYDPDLLKIGKKYSKKLSLNEDQMAMLNRMSFAGNVFNEIDYCRVQIIKQFLRSVEHLYQNCIPVNKSYPTVIDELSEIIVCLRYNYKKDSLNYSYTYQSVKTEIFNHILKLCENTVREVYDISLIRILTYFTNTIKRLFQNLKFSLTKISTRCLMPIIRPILSLMRIIQIGGKQNLT
jgi:hypothetical protein